MTKYYRNAYGEYVGAFINVEPPAGSIEVGFPPDDATYIWNGTEWLPSS